LDYYVDSEEERSYNKTKQNIRQLMAGGDTGSARRAKSVSSGADPYSTRNGQSSSTRAVRHNKHRV
jgi:hypothetical protein